MTQPTVVMKFKISSFAMLKVVSLALCTFSHQMLFADVPSTINFRGHLLNVQGNPVTGTVQATISVYDSQTGGNLVYTEIIDQLSVKDGRYSFQFGGASNPSLLTILPSLSEAWLEVGVNGAQLDRQKLVSVPYAMVAQSLGDGASAQINGAISLSPQTNAPYVEAGNVALYAKPDGKLYFQGLDGEEKEVSGGGGFISDSPEGSRSIIAVPIGSSVPPEYNFYQHASYDQNASWEYLGGVSTYPTSAGDNNNELFPSVLAGTEIHFLGYDNGTKFHKIFDTSNDQWSEGDNSFDTPESNRPIIASLNGKIYKFNSSYYGNPRISQVYDISTKNWSNITSAPIAHQYGAAAVFEGKIVIFFWGGNTTRSQYYDSYTCIYDPQTGSWTTDNNHPIKYISGGDAIAEVIDNELWVVNGRSQYYFNLHNFKNSFQNQKVIGFDERYVNPAGIFKYRNSIFIPSTSGYMTRYLPEKNSFSLLEKFPAPGHIRVHFVNNKIFSLRKNSSSNKYELYRLDLDETFKNLYDLYAIPGNFSANANSGTSSSGTPSIIRVSNEEEAPSGYTQIKQESIEWRPEGKQWGEQTSEGGDLISVNGKLYSHANGFIARYDHNNSQWVGIPNPPESHQAYNRSQTHSRAGVTGLGTKIYIVGGSAKVSTFDTATNEWGVGPDLPVGVWNPCVESFDGKIYVFGAKDFNENGSSNTLKSVFELDVSSNTWTTKNSRDTGGYTAPTLSTSEVLGDYIYQIGGTELANNRATALVYRYKPSTDTWDNAANMPTVFNRHASFVMNGKIYVFGAGSFVAYDPQKNSWKFLENPPFSQDSYITTYPSATVHSGRIWINGIKAFRQYYSTNNNYGATEGTYSGLFSDALFIAENSTSTSTGSSSSTTNNYPANLFMPYGTNGEPVFAEDTYTVPDGKVLITSNFTGYIKIGGAFINDSSHDTTYEHTQDIAIIDGGQTFSIYYSDSGIDGGFAGLLFEKKQEIQPVAGGTNYTVPAGKKLFITSSQGGVTLNGVWVNTRRSPIGAIPIIVPAGTDVVIWKNGAYDTPAGFSGYLMDE